MAAAPVPTRRLLTLAELNKLTPDQLVALGMQDAPNQGAPADFGGIVLPNPSNIRPMADTDRVIDPVRLSAGAQFITKNANGAPQMDTSSPAAAQLLAPQMQTVGAKGDGATVHAATTVPMIAPDGSLGDIPYDQVKVAQANGGKVAISVKSPDGKPGWVPADRLKEAIQAGAQMVPLKEQDNQHPGFWNAFAGDITGMVKGAAGMALGATPGADLVPHSIRDKFGVRTPLEAGYENVKNAAQQWKNEKQAGYSTPYRVAAQAGSAVGVNVPGMEKSAAEGDVSGVAGHATAPIAVMAATEGARAAGRMPAMQDLAQVKAQQIADAGTKTVRGTARTINKALAKAPGTVGGTVGAGVGGYLGGHIGAEVGGAAGAIAGKELLPQVRIPGEQFGLPKTVAGGPQSGSVPRYGLPETVEGGETGAPQAAPKPDTSPNAIQSKLNDALGGKPLAKNVPLRQQVPALQKAATEETKLPDGFTPVESSALRGYKYDPQTREFESVTTDGRRYVHGDVSPEEASAFEAAESKGRAWSQLKSQNPLIAKVLNGKRVSIKPSATVATEEEAPGGVIKNEDLTPALQQSLQNIKNLPRDNEGYPIRYVYRARDVGEEGVPLTNSHASATSDPHQALEYAEPGQRSSTQGQVVKIDLSKLSPKDYVVKKHPDGALWFQFTRPLTEAEVEHYAGATKSASK